MNPAPPVIRTRSATPRRLRGHTSVTVSDTGEIALSRECGQRVTFLCRCLAPGLGGEAGEQEGQPQIGGETEYRQRRPAQPGRPLADRPEDREREPALRPEAGHQPR